MHTSNRHVALPLAILTVAAAAASLDAAEVKVQGYAEWRDRGVLVVDGQRVRPTARASFKLGGEARDFASIPLGYEVTAEGRRAPDGAILADKVEAKPNGQALFEKQVLAMTDQE